MRKVFLATVVVALCLVIPALAQAAGFRFIQVPADSAGPALEGAMWYPCAKPAEDIDLGKITTVFKITVRGAKDCPIGGDKLPLVVVSHGFAGDFTDHRDLAETLADAGFVVAAIDHPGDTSFDLSRDGDLSAWVERPTDIKRLTDFMLDASPAASNIDPQRIGFFGFSKGGYTGLVLIGANPDWAIALCTGFHDPREPSSSAPACEQILEKGFRVQPLAHDPRIKAAVIADPFSLWFVPDSLAAVTIPVQLWASERQTEIGGNPQPSAESVAAVDRSLPAKHEYHVVPNATHVAFLSICPPGFAGGLLSACRQGLSPLSCQEEKAAEVARELCTDAPGFDRAAFHKEFNAAVLAFFREHLAVTP
jgi:predicted dienelactone hydrolase